MTIFLGGPSPTPSGPGRIGGADGIVAPLEGVEEGLVGGQSLFGDHVPDEDYEYVVGYAGGGFS